jgi:dTDP-4-amino-4,6-dideoxygalactose transaminase
VPPFPKSSDTWGRGPYILPEFNMLGYNYRMTDLQGAVGVVQMKKLDTFIDERDRWAKYYKQELAAIPWLRTPSHMAGYRHGWQSYVTLVDQAKAPMARNEIMDRLQAQGVSTRPEPMQCTCWPTTVTNTSSSPQTTPVHSLSMIGPWRFPCITG